MIPEGTPNNKPAILDAILAETRRGLPELRQRRDQLERRAADRVRAPGFASALRRDRVAVIAEIKRRSPSAGTINAALDPVAQARQYADGGASAVSVLTEGPHFGGAIADLEAVARAVDLPRLRKDFIVDEIQIVEAAATGASAVLLIVAALEPARVRQLLESARSWHLDALVEAHDARELAIAVDAGAGVVGVNARNLNDFRVDVPASLELISTLSAELVAVAESGMANRSDVERAAAAGADAVLIGGALAAAVDPLALTRSLSSVVRRDR